MKTKYAPPIQETLYRDGWKDALRNLERTISPPGHTPDSYETRFLNIIKEMKEDAETRER